MADQEPALTPLRPLKRLSLSIASELDLPASPIRARPRSPLPPSTPRASRSTAAVSDVAAASVGESALDGRDCPSSVKTPHFQRGGSILAYRTGEQHDAPTTRGRVLSPRPNGDSLEAPIRADERMRLPRLLAEDAPQHSPTQARPRTRQARAHNGSFATRNTEEGSSSTRREPAAVASEDQAPAEVPTSGEEAPSARLPASDGGPAGLVDQHNNLLTAIAKKERRCTELRAELARQELGLQKLKQKWQAAVSRSLASGQSIARSEPPTGSAYAPSLIADEPGRPAATIVADAGERHSPSIELGAREASSSRVGPASTERSTAGAMAFLTGTDGLPLDLSGALSPAAPAMASWDATSASAKKWVGGLFDMWATAAEEARQAALVTGTQRRADRGIASGKTGRLKARPLEDVDEVGEPELEQSRDEDVEEKHPTTDTGPQLSAESLQGVGISQRSTMDAFAATAGSWSRKWTGYAELAMQSDAFKTSKRATLNLVEGFERTLSDAISIDVPDVKGHQDSVQALSQQK